MRPPAKKRCASGKTCKSCVTIVVKSQCDHCQRTFSRKGPFTDGLRALGRGVKNVSACAAHAAKKYGIPAARVGAHYGLKAIDRGVRFVQENADDLADLYVQNAPYIQQWGEAGLGQFEAMRPAGFKGQLVHQLAGHGLRYAANASDAYIRAHQRNRRSPPPPPSTRSTRSYGSYSTVAPYGRTTVRPPYDPDATLPFTLQSQFDRQLRYAKGGTQPVFQQIKAASYGRNPTLWDTQKASQTNAGAYQSIPAWDVPTKKAYQSTPAWQIATQKAYQRRSQLRPRVYHKH